MTTAYPWRQTAFQSTPPVKAATTTENGLYSLIEISIHAAREGGDYSKLKDSPDVAISIHAAREGGDIYERNYCNQHKISIHAAREGGDKSQIFKS